MKLETTLIELSALVEYGSKYLIDRTEMANENAFDLYNLTSLADFMEYADLDDYDLLDHIDKSTIIEHLSNTYGIEDVFDEYDIKDYVRCNMSVDEIFSEDDIKDYVTENCDVNDVFDDYDICQYVKDNFDADDMYDEEITEIAQSMVEDMSFNEILDIKGGSEEDILDCLKNSSIIDYVADRFDVYEAFDINLANIVKDADVDIIFGLYDHKDIFGYLYENCGEDEWVDFVSHNFALAQFVEWV